MSVTIYRGDCRNILSLVVADESVDSCVTDPPYGLRFMGRKWDYQVPSVDAWQAVYQVLKPGAWLLAFGGTRTYHRLVCNVEDAGFEIRDQVQWLYGSGFPKSANGAWGGTALKPAHEPIVLARKPPRGTNAENFAQFGVGGLNVDACRVGTESTKRVKEGGANQFPHEDDAWAPKTVQVGSDSGRWPANVIHDGSDEVLAAFPDAPGQIANASSSSSARKTQNVYGAMKRGNEARAQLARGDSGSAARFFYCAKPSRAERDKGCEQLPDREGGMRSETSGQHITRRDGGDPKPVKNHHPTVKPVALMRYLVRLVTPPGGVVLDPYLGSGTTALAAKLEGFSCIGCEREAEYIDIAQRRLG